MYCSGVFHTFTHRNSVVNSSFDANIYNVHVLHALNGTGCWATGAMSGLDLTNTGSLLSGGCLTRSSYWFSKN